MHQAQRFHGAARQTAAIARRRSLALFDGEVMAAVVLPQALRCQRSARRGVTAIPLPEVLAASAQDPDRPSEPSQPGSKATRGVLWFANIYVAKVGRFDVRPMLTHQNHNTLIPKLLPKGVEIVKILPREKEGGAFVHFRAPPSFVLQVLKSTAGDDRKDTRFVRKGDLDIVAKVSDGICQYLKTHNVRAFLVPLPVRAYRVKGDPYLEELESRFPSSRLKIRIEPAGAVSEEKLYQQLRRYGTLMDITKTEDGKAFHVDYQYIGSAVAARNCLHRARITPEQDGGEAPILHIEFLPFIRKWMREAITTNARYSLPLLVFFTLGLTYLVLDPLRKFTVQFRIARLLAVERAHHMLAAQSEAEFQPPLDADGDAVEVPKPQKSRAGGGVWEAIVWVLSHTHRAQDLLQRASMSVGLLSDEHHRKAFTKDFWAHREEEVAEIRTWLAEPKDEVMLLTGRRGNGQSSFVKDVCGMRGVHMNVSRMLEAGGAFDDRIFLREFGKSFGYWPTQGMDRQMTALLDLMLPGSSKLSRENEVLVAVQRVLATVTSAMQEWRDRRRETSAFDTSTCPGLPLIVIDGFTSENRHRREKFFESLVIWAAYVSEEQLARVLFIADSSFAEPAMLQALGNRPERLAVRELIDAKPEAVRNILTRHFGAGHRAANLSDAEIACIGGRFRDISAYVEQVHRGISPSQAVRRLREGAEGTVRTLLMRGQEGSKWTRPQLWRAVTLFSKVPHGQGVPYDVFLWQVFRGDEAGVQSMKESNLIAVAAAPPVPEQPRAFIVYPGSPLFAEAFRRLHRNEGLRAVLDVEVAKVDIQREATTLEGYETELVRLQEVDDVWHDKRRGIADPNAALRKRKVQLLGLIEEQHAKLEGYHKERRDAMKKLKKSKEAFVKLIASDVPDEGRSTNAPPRTWWAWLGLA